MQHVLQSNTANSTGASQDPRVPCVVTRPLHTMTCHVLMLLQRLPNPMLRGTRTDMAGTRTHMAGWGSWMLCSARWARNGRLAATCVSKNFSKWSTMNMESSPGTLVASAVTPMGDDLTEESDSRNNTRPHVKRRTSEFTGTNFYVSSWTECILQQRPEQDSSAKRKGQHVGPVSGNADVRPACTHAFG